MGVAVAFRFDTEADARAFATSPDVGGWLPVDTGRHIYYNWEPVMNKLAGAHSSLNPYTLPENQGLRMDYSVDMCKKSVDILSSTVVINPDPDWSDKQVEERITACRNALDAL